ncbi:MAG: glycine cleavage system protein GcvH [Betaproteobacteria bacterium]|nr:glycine cleavage system protein GcvH [Betaproteobacteria bacterium]
MKAPETLKYTATHEWVKTEGDGTVTVGITDHAQEALGDIVFLELPKVGAKGAAGEQIAVIESVKAASDIYFPVAGEVVAINEALTTTPEQVNADAFAAWMFKIKPDNAGDVDKLMSAADYAVSAS